MSEIAYNPPALDTTAITGRLAHCAKVMGGKRALAKAAGLSEAQLFRYLNGASDMAVSRLTAIAEAAKVSPGWLLTGEDVLPPPPRPDFHPATMAQVVQTLEEYLLEYPIKFTPKQKGQMFALVYDAIRHDEHHFNIAPSWNREKAFQFLDFMAALKANNDIENYHAVFEHAEVLKRPFSPEQALNFERLVNTGNQGVYNGISGKMYLERMGHAIPPERLQEMLGLLQLVNKGDVNKPIHWLDLGCGKGLHMLALAKYARNVNLFGLDASSLSAAEIEPLIARSRLENARFDLGNLTSLPYPDSSMDVVYASYSLNFVPYIPSANVGMKLAIQEIVRVLKTNGICHIRTSHGQGRSWLLFRQYLDEIQIRELLQKEGLGIISHRYTTKFGVVKGDFDEKDYISNMRDSVHSITVRKLP
ncbi:MAG: methyltransferase domain-containing protein [Pseudomonadaceae bacterium]|nr:methyltransferase domain-containing protein [Pseudomonadaceae bacterium]